VDAPGAPVVLTNHHVLFDWSDGERRASRVEVWFSYETGVDGPKPVSAARADPTTIVGRRDTDWAIVRLAEPMPAGWPSLSLRPSSPPEVDTPAFIIQHPGGRMKQVGLTRNQIQLVDERVVHYLTDTEAGSSGSPVFNDRWEVIALHHRWVAIPQQRRRPPVHRNEGIRIERVREGLVAAGVLPNG
jgi:endonuclease G